MNKTISINPELFSHHSRGTRKKLGGLKEIKVKELIIPKEHNATLSKRNLLLKFIRRHQENNTKNQLDDTKKANNTQPICSSDFDKSLKYLMDKTVDAENNNKNGVDAGAKSGGQTPNYTLKNHNIEHENVSMVFPGSEENLVPIKLPVFHSDSNSPRITLSAPRYGCLKNGTLPTYRQFHRGQTQKNPEREISGNPIIENNKSNSLGNMLEIDDTIEKKTYASLRYPSRKKTLRRTFVVGKSPKHSKISVLVSNKTIRHEISNKNQLLKQTPLVEVKKYLIKCGLIKTGSSAPPEVLRKMYESASLMCGDVKNHNNEILMFNYMNA